jgi:hypothetical protein
MKHEFLVPVPIFGVYVMCCGFGHRFPAQQEKGKKREQGVAGKLVLTLRVAVKFLRY